MRYPCDDTHPVVERVLWPGHAAEIGAVGLRSHTRRVIRAVVGGSRGAGRGLLAVDGYWTALL